MYFTLLNKISFTKKNNNFNTDKEIKSEKYIKFKWNIRKTSLRPMNFSGFSQMDMRSYTILFSTAFTWCELFNLG